MTGTNDREPERACPRCSAIPFGPVPCQGCRELVWWSGARWVNRDGTPHRNLARLACVGLMGYGSEHLARTAAAIAKIRATAPEEYERLYEQAKDMARVTILSFEEAVDRVLRDWLDQR